MFEHVCNADLAVGPICSHLATSAFLNAHGFPVKMTEKCVGMDLVLRDGTSFEDAQFMATEAGLLRTCTKREELT